MSDDDHDLDRFSGTQFTPAERQRFRRDMANFERMMPLLDAYERGSAIGRFFVIVGAWLIGAGVAALGVVLTLKEIGWWPFAKGG